MSIRRLPFVVVVPAALAGTEPDPPGGNDMPQYLLSVWHDEDDEVDFSGE